ncbi:SusC/RagA family TonB-linked outer membrane protein [Salinimicrobium marinum]|uniref:SusC/RagA family TonB-linked outer membrane protein n=1 Tax=Salinimicrobium marinum TaxID=680283 RepID=A0A918VZ19_9FLAO|nr:TonB-dependent receptor [Salinimicrobium marinum]GHA38531.1 SusC/RagA family TonB-linked outer membrane protein [Salinimicrobium marinum]
MRKKLTLVLSLFIFLISAQTFAQEREVTGQVLDEAGMPIPGVSVYVKDTSVGTITDFDGEFSLEISGENAVLVFSYVGFQTREIPVDDQSTIQVTLSSDVEDLDEVVVVGYGVQRRANLTGAVSTVNTEVLESRPITDVARGLQGTTPGLTITSPTGQIGENPSINLRGAVGSLGSSGGAQPLILVDNVEVPNLNAINPQDIKDISVLKDAASTSIYGSRAAWGVILITTKSGKRNQAPTISYSNNFSWATPTTTPQVAPAAEGAEMAFEALRRTDPSQDAFGIVGMWIDQTSIQRMRDWEAQYGGQDLGMEMVEGRDFERRDGRLFFYRPWDPLDMFMEEWAPQQKHDLSVSGGSENTNYYVGLGYLGQEGVLKVNPDQYDRYNLNMRIDTDVKDWWSVRASVLHSNSLSTEPFLFSSATYDPWYYVTRWPATYPYGTFEGQPFRNHISEVEQAKMNETSNSLSRINLGTTFRPIEGLSINMDYTHDRVEEHEHQTGGVLSAYNFWATGPNLEYAPYSSAVYNRVQYNSSWSRRNTAKAFATYEIALGDHDVKLTAGGDMEEYEYWFHSSQRRNLFDLNVGELELATGDEFVTGDRNKWATLGAFGRINYSYLDKFLLEVNGRYDGSSRLSADKKWAFFPSFSAGYIISEEEFMDFAKPTLSFLKIRGSYGAIGNQNADLRNIYRVMTPANSNWIIGGQNVVTVGGSTLSAISRTPGALPASLTWETVTTLDFGVDSRFFNNRLGASFDWYERTVSDMHSQGVTLPSSFGTDAPRRNYGELQTRGWELTVDFKHSFENGLNINAMATLSDYQEKVTKFSNTTEALPNPITGLNNTYYEGMMLGEIWGYETDRLFTEDDFDANGDYAEGVPSQEIFETNSWFNFGPGDVKYRDINGDGVIDYGSNTRGDSGDLKVIGNSTPRYQYGLQLGADWKGFDLSMFMQGVGQRDMWANGPVIIPGYRPAEGWYEHQLDYWTPENTDAYYPRPTNANQQVNPTNFQPQTRYLLDMSYLRMKNITFGYSLPQSLTENIHLNNFRVYFSGENLFEFTNLDVPIDPEINYTTAGLNDSNSFGRVYPFRRSLSIGLQASF